MNTAITLRNDEPQKLFSWTAIIAGALANIGLSFLLNLSTLAIGLSAFTTDREGAISLALGGLLAIAIGAAIIMFLSGWIAGYLGTPFYFAKPYSGILYGFIAWCLALLISVSVASQVGDYVTAYTNVVSHPVSTSSPTIANPPMVVETVSAQADVRVNKSDEADAAHKTGAGLSIIFILFFIGALSSCVGGHYGSTARNSL
jgi:hypothetical protein